MCKIKKFQPRQELKFFGAGRGSPARPDPKTAPVVRFFARMRARDADPAPDRYCPLTRRRRQNA